ncbi:PREDICTED: DNA replication complex GINS protein SLD5 isoform X1 [Papilio xuthus]|uniref:DNA replication complex GINS protein SLD5 n=1 Tax=Papilio xuthus TaxID=66420 RepID=A0A194PQD0_PAPXU|nr:PREDICTED: DNA replication complex GINS protein SLD5 isoform X1 [Papilio xuthus]KPI93340.1 DNA replication complex GINS protein SLD5 [Papilio xuthus]
MEYDNIELSDDEEEITAQTVLRTLQNAWQNERLAPEILPHQNEMVECMLGQIQHMERNINKLPKTDLRASIHKMELNRIKFIICNYLKTRLDKIEKYCISILNDEKQRLESGTNYLTPSEYKYAQEYLINMESHLKEAALDHVPGNMQSFDLNKLVIYPNLQAHVFLKANETVTGIILEDLGGDQDEEIDLEENSQHILQYKPIADLLKSGKVQLM